MQRGFYDGMKIQRSDGFVVQTGDPSKEGRGDKVGFVEDGKVRNVPLEVFVKGRRAEPQQSARPTPHPMPPAGPATLG